MIHNSQIGTSPIEQDMAYLSKEQFDASVDGIVDVLFKTEEPLLELKLYSKDVYHAIYAHTQEAIKVAFSEAFKICAHGGTLDTKRRYFSSELNAEIPRHLLWRLMSDPAIRAELAKGDESAFADAMERLSQNVQSVVCHKFFTLTPPGYELSQ